MKKHTFPITVTCILLASVLLLTGCMYAVVDDMGTSKSYTTEIAETLTTEELKAQAEMQKKFGVYLHKTENGVQIFSEEQYGGLKAVRDSGGRVPLSYEEVLFLINDSINLYFKYDEIALYGTEGLKLIYAFDGVVKTYHPADSEKLSASSAYSMYEDIIGSIWLIIMYRLGMHDAGFVPCSSDSIGEYLARFFASEGDVSEASIHEYYMLSLNGSKEGGDANKASIREDLDKALRYPHTPFSTETNADALAHPMDAPLLVADGGAGIPRSGIWCIDPATHEIGQLFPTPELNVRILGETSHLTSAYLMQDFSRQTLCLDRSTGRFHFETADSFTPLALTGRFSEALGYLTLYPDGNDGKNCFYVFSCPNYFSFRGVPFEYLPQRSVPMESFDFAENTAFCAEHKSYLYHKASSKDSGIIYRIGDETVDSFSATQNLDIDFGSDRGPGAYIDTFPIKILFGMAEVPEVTVSPSRALTAELPRSADIYNAELYIKDEDSNTYTKLDLPIVLADLPYMPEGTYYLAMYVKRRFNIGGYTAQKSFIDAFKIVVQAEA